MTSLLLISRERIAECSNVAWFQGVIDDWELETLLPPAPKPEHPEATRKRVLGDIEVVAASTKVAATEDARLEKQIATRDVLSQSGGNGQGSAAAVAAVTSWIDEVRAEAKAGNVGLVPPLLRNGTPPPLETRLCLEHFAEWYIKHERRGAL